LVFLKTVFKQQKFLLFLNVHRPFGKCFTLVYFTKTFRFF